MKPIIIATITKAGPTTKVRKMTITIVQVVVEIVAVVVAIAVSVVITIVATARTATSDTKKNNNNSNQASSSWNIEVYKWWDAQGEGITHMTGANPLEIAISNSIATAQAEYNNGVLLYNMAQDLSHLEDETMNQWPDGSYMIALKRAFHRGDITMPQPPNTSTTNSNDLDDDHNKGNSINECEISDCDEIIPSHKSLCDHHAQIDLANPECEEEEEDDPCKTDGCQFHAAYNSWYCATCEDRLYAHDESEGTHDYAVEHLNITDTPPDHNSQEANKTATQEQDKNEIKSDRNDNGNDDSSTSSDNSSCSSSNDSNSSSSSDGNSNDSSDSSKCSDHKRRRKELNKSRESPKQHSALDDDEDSDSSEDEEESDSSEDEVVLLEVTEGSPEVKYISTTPPIKNKPTNEKQQSKKKNTPSNTLSSTFKKLNKIVSNTKEHDSSESSSSEEANNVLQKGDIRSYYSPSQTSNSSRDGGGSRSDSKRKRNKQEEDTGTIKSEHTKEASPAVTRTKAKKRKIQIRDNNKNSTNRISKKSKRSASQSIKKEG